MESLQKAIELIMVADGPDALGSQDCHYPVPLAGLELATTVGGEVDRRNEAWHPGVDQSSSVR